MQHSARPLLPPPPRSAVAVAHNCDVVCGCSQLWRSARVCSLARLTASTTAVLMLGRPHTPRLLTLAPPQWQDPLGRVRASVQAVDPTLRRRGWSARCRGRWPPPRRQYVAPFCLSPARSIDPLTAPLLCALTCRKELFPDASRAPTARGRGDASASVEYVEQRRRPPTAVAAARRPTCSFVSSTTAAMATSITMSLRLVRGMQQPSGTVGGRQAALFVQRGQRCGPPGRRTGIPWHATARLVPRRLPG